MDYSPHLYKNYLRERGAQYGVTGPKVETGGRHRGWEQAEENGSKVTMQPVAKRQCKPPCDRRAIGIPCDTVGRPIIGRPMAKNKTTHDEDAMSGKVETDGNDGEGPSWGINKENEGGNATAFGDNEGDRPNGPKRKRVRKRNRNKGKKKLNVAGLGIETEPNHDDGRVEGEEEWIVPEMGTQMGEYGPDDNQFHIDMIQLPEVDLSHTAELIAHLTGDEEFDFEVDVE